MKKTVPGFLNINCVWSSKVKILHSPAYRAVLTANALKRLLIEAGKSVTVEESKRLEQDSTMITKGSLEGLSEDLESDEFALLITHEPVINSFLGRDYGINNCQILGHGWMVEGHERFS